MGEVKLKIMGIVFLVMALGMFIGLCGPKAALADVTLSDPSLPPLAVSHLPGGTDIHRG